MKTDEENQTQLIIFLIKLALKPEYVFSDSLVHFIFSKKLNDPIVLFLMIFL
jgi:hypothetical protein